MKQTQTNDDNRALFYQQCYGVLSDTKERLFDIQDNTMDVVAIDCCGWYYQKIFDRPVISLETVNNAKQFRLTRDQFTKLVDDNKPIPLWPKLALKQDCLVILDRPLILKYRSLQDFTTIVQDICNQYQPKKLYVRGNLQFIDDSRIVDRFYHWFQFKINGWVITKFVYDADATTYDIRLKKRV